jgi:hypothetical protein
LRRSTDPIVWRAAPGLPWSTSTPTPSPFLRLVKRSGLELANDDGERVAHDDGRECRDDDRWWVTSRRDATEHVVPGICAKPGRVMTGPPEWGHRTASPAWNRRRKKVHCVRSAKPNRSASTGYGPIHDGASPKSRRHLKQTCFRVMRAAPVQCGSGSSGKPCRSASTFRVRRGRARPTSAASAEARSARTGRGRRTR